MATALTFTCSMCLNRPVACDGDVCTDCRRWADYWQSLTPEQQRAEELAMARYATESEGL